MGVVIRNAKAQDLAPLRRLAADTAYFGESGGNFFPDVQALGILLMDYYVRFEPQHTWVAEEKGEVIGYLSACYDEKEYSRKFLSKVLPPALVSLLKTGAFLKPLFFRTLFFGLLCALTGDGRLKNDKSKHYEVHIHMNMKAGTRGKGIGSRLVEAFLRDFKQSGKNGARFRSLRTRPEFHFFHKFGFERVDSQRVKIREKWMKRKPLFLMEYGKSN